MDYVYNILIFISIYVILAYSLDLLIGHSGILTLSQAAFYGIGAYTSGILTTGYHYSFAIALILSCLVSCFVGAALCFITIRLKNDYLIIGSFGFQIIAFSIFNNATSLTNGPLGIRGIPQPAIFSLQINSNEKFLLLSSFFAIVSYLIVFRLTSSPFGRVLHAIREDQAFTESIGKNTIRFKITTFSLSAALAALAGCLYAHYISFIDPTSFTITESVLIISMVIIGGIGNTWGPLIGAAILVTLPEVLRFIGLPSSIAANLRQIIYGTLLVIMILFRPEGLLGKLRFGQK